MSRGLLAAVGAALVLLAGCTSGDADAAPETSAGGPDVSKVHSDLEPCPDQTDQPAADDSLPDVRLPCFNGGSLDLGKAPGVPMVVNFWASWCTPCRDELPEVQQLAGTAGDRVRVVGVVSKDGVSQAASFASDAGATFPSAFDESGVAMGKVGLRGLPGTLFITADGRLAYTKIGQVASLGDLEQLVADHLGVQL